VSPQQSPKKLNSRGPEIPKVRSLNHEDDEQLPRFQQEPAPSIISQDQSRVPSSILKSKSKITQEQSYASGFLSPAENLKIKLDTERTNLPSSPKKQKEQEMLAQNLSTHKERTPSPLKSEDRNQQNLKAKKNQKEMKEKKDKKDKKDQKNKKK